MASKLVGLKKILAWGDFKEIREAKPGPGQLVAAAKTRAITAISHKVAPTEKSGEGFTLKDKITFTVSLDPNSWVKSWVLRELPEKELEALRKHEQGHYDLAALITRDYFIDIMDIKNWEYESAADVDWDYQYYKSEMKQKSAEVEDLYETETANGTKKAEQAAWNDYIQKAFSEVRGDGSQSPGGTMYKKTLLSLLRAAKKTI